MARIDDLSSDVREVKTHLDWHFKVGGGGLAILFGALFFAAWWYLPSELAKSRDVSKGDIRELLRPIENQLARLVADTVTAGENAGPRVLQAMEQSLDNQSERRAGLATIGATAQKASERRVLADPTAIRSIGDRVLALTSAPAHGDAAWEAAVRLADYRSFLNGTLVSIPNKSLQTTFSVAAMVTSRPKPGARPSDWKDSEFQFRFYGPVTNDCARSVRLANKSDPCAAGPSLIELYGLQREGVDRVLLLDGYYFKDMVVRDMVIQWNGGPFEAKNVAFLNCTFDFKQQAPSEPFVRQLFAGTHVTYSVQG